MARGCIGEPQSLSHVRAQDQLGSPGPMSQEPSGAQVPTPTPGAWQPLTWPAGTWRVLTPPAGQPILRARGWPQPAALHRLPIPSFSANWHLIPAICVPSESWLPLGASSDPLAHFQSDASSLGLQKCQLPSHLIQTENMSMSRINYHGPNVPLFSGGLLAPLLC